MPYHGPTSRNRIALRILRGFLALVFLSAGIAKMIGAPTLVAGFEQIGFGQWFRYATGAIEIAGAALLLTHRLVGVGALALTCTMVGAILAHLLVVPGSAVPAAVLLILSAVVAFAYRDRTLVMVGLGVRAPTD